MLSSFIILTSVMMFRLRYCDEITVDDALCKSLHDIVNKAKLKITKEKEQRV